MLFVKDIPLLLSNSSLSGFPLPMLVVFDLFHGIGIVSFSNILLNVWDNDFVNSPPPYFMNSFFIWSGPVLLLFLSDFIACFTSFSLMGSSILSFSCFLFSCHFSISFSMNSVQDLWYVDDVFFNTILCNKVLCIVLYLFH